MTGPLLQRAFAAVYDPVLAGAERRGLAGLRADLLGGLDGTVVELGAGTGANLSHYGPRVNRVLATEPSGPMADRARRRAAHLGRDDLDVEVVQASAERLPVGDGVADAVVATLVLCSVRDVEQVVAEARRVLRPGGRFVLIEHVLGTGRRARVQRLLQPAWKPLAGGCHLTRDPWVAMRAAGFDVTGLRRTSLPLPWPAAPGLVGTAAAP